MMAALLGVLLRPWRRRNALAWRPGGESATGVVQARVKSVGYAVAGLTFAVRNEANMRIHCVAAIAAVAAGILLRIDANEWRWLILAIALVIASEALNTAIEQACDAIGGRSEPIRHAKDAAAGGVLVLAVAAAVIGLCIFVPHIVAAWHGGRPTLPLCSF
ncbi:diacylglycerol kinase family protein [Sphingomonas asaccharolytica]|uniref:diacylglycerol kinase family protein n=1 Tax=Sphingomonas asaccharolytica TaxID=40681 RepID=UPI001FDFC0AD|nr:diacylglycerol kinase family protein [Sphingomonas asaccharolytica]